MLALLDRLLLHRRLPWIATTLAVLLALPSLNGGFLVDDWYHRARLDQEAAILPPGRGPILELFAFFPSDPEETARFMQEGFFPWWTDPQIRGAFLRPVTALTHWLDWQLWRDSPVLQHAHSLLWLAACVTAAGALFRRWLGEGRATSLATLIFALDDAHSWPATWLANRNALVAMTSGALAVTAHLGSAGKSGRTLLSMILLAAALFSAEAGFATVGVMAALTLLGEGTLRQRIQLLLPPAAVALGWALIWRQMGYGVSGSGLYIDPIRNTADFLTAMPTRMAAMMAVQWLNAPVDGWVLLPRNWEIPAAAFLTMLVVGMMAWVATPTLKADPRARQALAGALLAAVPNCAGFPMERLVAVGGLCGAAFLGLVLDRTTREGRLPISSRILLWMHLPMSGLMLLLKSYGIPTLMSGSTNAILTILADPQVERHHVVVISGVELTTAYVPIIGQLQFQRRPASMALMVPAATPARVTRLDENTLKFELPSGGFRHAVERLCRSGPFVAGEVVTLPDVTITLVSVNENGEPTEFIARYARPLEDPDWRWYGPRGLEVEPWTPPSVGSSVDIPPVLDLP